MSNYISYKILDKQSLIIEYYRGRFYIDQLIDFKKEIGKNEKFNPNFNILSDIRELEFLFNIGEVKKYIKFLLENHNHIGNRKTVMITNTPNQVVTSLGFDMLKGDLPIDFKVYSLVETAYSSLKLSSTDQKQVNSHLMALKNKAK